MEAASYATSAAAQTTPGPERPREPATDCPPAARAAFGAGIVAEFGTIMIHRIFATGLTLASAASLFDGPAAVRIQHAVDELVVLIRDIRTTMFELLPARTA